MIKEKKYFVGVDVGGTNMKAVLFNGEMVLADYLLATPKDSLDHFLVMLVALIEPLLERARKDKVKIVGIGLGVPGVHDYENGRVLKSPNVPILDGVSLAAVLNSRINLPVKMDNDANCFVRAEALVGVGKKYNNIYGITIGTGVGGGWWHRGEVYLGNHGAAGEPGEMVISTETEIGLEEAYHKLTQNNPVGMADEAYRGDVLAEKTYVEVGRIFGLAFANIVNLLDPEIIIVGGGAVGSSDLFLSETYTSMQKHIESTIAQKKIKIVKSKTKHAGAIGAALLFQETVV